MFFSAIQYRGQNKRPLRTLKIEYKTYEKPFLFLYMFCKSLSHPLKTHVYHGNIALLRPLGPIAPLGNPGRNNCILGQFTFSTG